MVCAWHAGGSRGSGIVSSVAYVLGMSVVRGMRAVGGVDERIGVGLYQSCGNKWSVGRVSVFCLRWCG